jgi:GNAT superfamily N-acetyltransferase
MSRHEYVCQQRTVRYADPTPWPVGVQVCALAGVSQEALAHLMLDAYRGTVDDAGETLADARHEVAHFWAGTGGITPWPEYSWGLRDAHDVLVAACMVGMWQSRQVPLIAYVLTHPEWQGQGLATALLRRVLHQLEQQQQLPVYAVVTAGNRPSEELMARVDFMRIPAL